MGNFVRGWAGQTALALGIALVVVAGPLAIAEGRDVLGVQPAGLDQPRINALLRLTPGGPPLTADLGGFTGFNIEAFLDTGASGILVSNETGDALGLTRTTAFNPSTDRTEPVIFSDVGVAGADTFSVSQTVYVALAPYHPETDADNPSTYNTVYNQTYGPVRTQFGPTPPSGEPQLASLDVFGMPLMAGKVVVLDPKPVDELDTMRTYIYNPGTPFNPSAADNNPGIPTTNRHVQLSYGSFDRFTEVTPPGAPGPTLSHNPFIGPNPVGKLSSPPPVDNTPPVVIGRTDSHGTPLTSSGSWLFDTGASASILSIEQAGHLSVHYAPGTFGTDNPELVDENGMSLPDQFSLSIGGIGGTSNLAGFFLDTLSIPTREGDPIRYVRAPVLVGDISVKDPVTNQSLTLDGVFGMNFLTASIFLDGGFPDLETLTGGNYDWIVFDEPTGTLGLQLSIPVPGDANLSGRTDFADLGTLLQNYNKRGLWAEGDFNSTGMVDFNDLGILLNHYNKTSLALNSLAVPEPSTFILLALGLAAFLIRRRR